MIIREILEPKDLLFIFDGHTRPVLSLDLSTGVVTVENDGRQVIPLSEGKLFTPEANLGEAK